MPKIIDWAIAGANAAASPLLRSMLPCTLVCAQIGVYPALADSKSSAEFMLSTCLVAMDDLAKVEALARKNNWIDKTSSISTPMNKFTTSRTVWDVTEGADRFFVWTWMNHFGEMQGKVCSVSFRNKVNREEFLNSIFASVKLTVIADVRSPHSEVYSVKVRSDRTAKLILGISSGSDGTLTGAMLHESAWPGLGASVEQLRLGVRVEQVTEDVAAGRKLKSARGALVTEVYDAAKSAGIQVGDVIVRMDYKDVPNTSGLIRILAETPANERVGVTIIRDGKERMFDMTLVDPFGRGKRHASPVWDSNPLPAAAQHNKPATEGTTTISK